MVLSAFKTFPKSKAKEITNSSEENFNQKLRTSLGGKRVKNNASFENVFLDTLNKHATPQKKVIRANHAPHVTKSLRKR